MQALSQRRKLIYAIFAVFGIGATYLLWQVYGETIIGMTIDSNADLRQGLVLQYTFDGRDIDFSQTSAEIRDRSSNALHGDWQNFSTTSTQSGRIGQALKFTGYADKVSVADNSNLDFTGSAQFTIALWIKPYSSTTFGTVVANSTSTYTTTGTSTFVVPTGVATVTIKAWGAGGGSGGSGSIAGANGGAGGGGGFASTTATVTPSETLYVLVGGGGGGGTATSGCTQAAGGGGGGYSGVHRSYTYLVIGAGGGGGGSGSDAATEDGGAQGGGGGTTGTTGTRGTPGTGGNGGGGGTQSGGGAGGTGGGNGGDGSAGSALQGGTGGQGTTPIRCPGGTGGTIGGGAGGYATTSGGGGGGGGGGGYYGGGGGEAGAPSSTETAGGGGGGGSSYATGTATTTVGAGATSTPGASSDYAYIAGYARGAATTTGTHATGTAGTAGFVVITYVATSSGFNTVTATTTLVSKSGGTGGGYKLYVEADGDLCFSIDDDSTWGPEDSVCTSGTNFYTDNAWHHVIVQKDGTTGLYLYVDNPHTPVAQDISLTASGDLSNNQALNLGADVQGTYSPVTGGIDDVRIYNRLLTDDQRNRLYGLGNTTRISTTLRNAYFEQGLVGYWTMDGGVTTGSTTYNVATTAVSFSFATSGLAATNSDITITGAASTAFGISLAVGDFNNDGIDDLAVGAWFYNSSQGRAYIFYNDGTMPTAAGSADIIITGESATEFGYALTTGDWNSDGIDDLAVGGCRYNSYQGKAYIFYNDGTMPTAAGSADIIITGEAGAARFGCDLTTGDWNSDGIDDLAVGGYGYSTYQGRAYIFYNDGTMPTDAGSADITITGEAGTGDFGISLTTGDWNSDGIDDLAVGADLYNASQGRAYIFYNDGTMPTAAGSADITITGETSTSTFGSTLTTGDWNSDGIDDLAVGANFYMSTFFTNGTGRAFIFYNDGTMPTDAGSADITITGETDSNFGKSLAVGDFNNDGIDDLVVGGDYYNSQQGRAYIYQPVIRFRATSTSLIPTPGRLGQALEFNGASNYARVGDMTTGGTVRSLSFWVRPDDNTSKGILKLNDIARVELDTSGNASTSGSGWTSPTIYVNGVQGTAVAQDSWSHVAIVNGVGITATNTVFGIATTTYFDGKLDDIRFYNRALTQDDVTRISGLGMTTRLGVNPPKSSLEDNLVGLWTFNGPTVSTSTVYDQSPSGYNGTFRNSVGSQSSLTTTTGVFGQGVTFTGNGNYLHIGTAASNVKTLALWVKTSSSTQYIVDLNGSAYLRLNSSTLTAQGFTTPTIYVDGTQTSSLPSDGDWHHIAVTTGTGINANNMDIGRVASFGSYTGNMDDVRIYSSALTATDINKLYQQGK